MRRQRGGFRRPCDASEGLVAGQNSLACLAHFLIGLNAEDAITVLEKQFAQNSGARSDVGDYGVRGQSTFGAKEIDDGSGIARAILDVVVHPVGKAFHCIHYTASYCQPSFTVGCLLRESLGSPP